MATKEQDTNFSTAISTEAGPISDQFATVAEANADPTVDDLLTGTPAQTTVPEIVVGVYSDLPPAVPVLEGDITSEAAKYDEQGARGVVSKRSRDDYSRVSYFYFSPQDRTAIQKSIDRMELQTQRDEFDEIFTDASRGPEGEIAPASQDGGAARTIEYNKFRGFVRFLLTDVSESFVEKHQIVEVLQDNYIPYFFGTAPTIINISGILINSVHDQWKYWFLLMYHKLIKGSKLAELAEAPVLRMYYEDTRIAGYPLSLSLGHNANSDTALPFSMQLLIKEYSVERPGEEALKTLLKMKAISAKSFFSGALNVNGSIVVHDPGPSPEPVPLGSRVGLAPRTVAGSTPKDAITVPQSVSETSFEGIDPGDSITPPGAEVNPADTDGITSLIPDPIATAAKDVIEDTVNDFLTEVGLDAGLTSIQGLIGSNLNPENFAENFVNDPIGTIRSVPTDIKGTKSDLLISKQLIKDAIANPSRVKHNTIADNVILGPFTTL